MTDKTISNNNLHTFASIFSMELFSSGGLSCSLTNAISLAKSDYIISVGTERCMCGLMFVQRDEELIKECFSSVLCVARVTDLFISPFLSC